MAKRFRIRRENSQHAVYGYGHRPEKFFGKKEKPAEFLWLCMGDGSTPENMGEDFSALADALREGRVEAPPFNWLITRRNMPGGFTSGPYQIPVEQIHLYWGDGEENFIRNLTKTEREEVETRVTKLFLHRD